MEDHTQTSQASHGEEEFTTEDISRLNEDKVDALINLLVKKGVFTEEELTAEIDDLYEEEEEGQTPQQQ
jgi:polyhydroxyalkanoate synthesis regulator phasin